ncbi:hypothetical protein C7T96_12665 [Nitratireductor sp. StC3]|nr:hypothetical protein C7T96_12665 [Nitratireductor sp. StC3]
MPAQIRRRQRAWAAEKLVWKRRPPRRARSRRGYAGVGGVLLCTASQSGPNALLQDVCERLGGFRFA